MTTEMRLVNDIIVTSEKLVELLILEKDYDPDVVPVIESLTDIGLEIQRETGRHGRVR